MLPVWVNDPVSHQQFVLLLRQQIQAQSRLKVTTANEPNIWIGSINVGGFTSVSSHLRKGEVHQPYADPYECLPTRGVLDSVREELE